MALATTSMPTMAAATGSAFMTLTMSPTSVQPKETVIDVVSTATFTSGIGVGWVAENITDVDTASWHRSPPSEVLCNQTMYGERWGAFGVSVTPIDESRWNTTSYCCSQANGRSSYQYNKTFTGGDSRIGGRVECKADCMVGSSNSLAELYNCFFWPGSAVEDDAGLTCFGQFAGDCHKNSAIISRGGPLPKTYAPGPTVTTPVRSATPTSSADHVSFKSLGLVALLLSALPFAM